MGKSNQTTKKIIDKCRVIIDGLITLNSGVYTTKEGTYHPVVDVLLAPLSDPVISKQLKLCYQNLGYNVEIYGVCDDDYGRDFYRLVIKQSLK